MKVLPRIQLGDPVLRQESRKLTNAEIQSADIQEFIKDMKYTLRTIKGVGLAAPQVGRNVQIFVINFKPVKNRPEIDAAEKLVVINPIIKPVKSKQVELWEGCLSFADIFGYVARPSDVEITYQDEKGQTQQRSASGFLARVLQHETDHLNGKVWIDGNTDSSTFMTKREYLKRVRKIKT